MNFQQLEYTLAVHRLKHFGKAAESCNVTQATLSAMLKKLEEELGIQLFERSKQPITTTEQGLEVVKIAKDILSKQQTLRELKNAGLKELDGKLRLGIIPTIANSLLPLILPSILKENPHLELNISEITTEEIIHQLETNQLDMGIIATPVPEEYPKLEEFILYYEAMMVYGINESKKEFVTSKDVENKQIWLLEEGHCFRNQSMTICNIQEKKISSNKLNFKSNSFETLLNLSDQFGGFTLLPELYFKNLSKKRQNKTKAFKAPIPVREVSLVAMPPVVKKQAIGYLSALIQTEMKSKLSTSALPNKALNIIGI